MFESRPDVHTERQMQQQQHNKPRSGFTHNCYTTGLGRLFQESIKRVMEKAIGKVWPLLLRYRCNGDAARIREGKRDPDTAFIYDDALFEMLNRSLKTSARKYLRDRDGKRKRTIVTQAIDLLLMLAFEDVYYRGLMKETIRDLVLEVVQTPELLELSEDEMFVDAVFNWDGVTSDIKSRKIAFIQLMQERVMENGAK